MSKKSNLLSCTVLASLLFAFQSAASASVLKLKNTDPKRNVDVVIEQGDGSVLPAKRAIKLVLEPGEEEEVDLSNAIFKSDTFSVTGTVKIPSMNNKCASLLINTNYKIVFSESKGGGIVCNAEAAN